MRWRGGSGDHMQIICTSHQTDNNVSTSSLNFLTRGIMLNLFKHH